ncbi:hypothetical protein [Ruegeria sp. SCP11]|uniref:hypothetical protein n=1 Tax=Ruegeria sp. SCP11 TaxID=3141378 RepID=UPI003338CDCA
MRTVILVSMGVGVVLGVIPNGTHADFSPSPVDNTVVEYSGENSSISYTYGSVLEIDIDSQTTDFTDDIVAETKEAVADTTTTGSKSTYGGDPDIAADALIVPAELPAKRSGRQPPRSVYPCRMAPPLMAEMQGLSPCRPRGRDVDIHAKHQRGRGDIDHQRPKKSSE